MVARFSSLFPERWRRHAPWLAHYPAYVPRELKYPAQPAYWLLEQAAQRAPGRVACQFHGQRWTYAELLEKAHGAGEALRQRGLQPGERVAILLPNMPEYLAALYGVWMAGGVAVSLNPLMVADEAADLLRATNCRFAVCLDLLLPLLGADREVAPELTLVTSLRDRLPSWQRLGYRLATWKRLGLRQFGGADNAIGFDDALAAASPEAEPYRPATEDAAYILPTGGTTGHPKAVVLTHRNLLANAWQIYHWSGSHFGHEVLLAVMPFFHSYGLTVCGLTGMAMGARLVMHHHVRAASALHLIEHCRPTIFPAVPALLTALNKSLRHRPRDLSSLRYCISGAAPLPPAVADEFSEHSGALVVEGYGLSEAGPVTHVGPLDGTARPGAIGLPLPDTEARIVDDAGRDLPPGEVGELVIRGPQVMRGYWNDPARTAHALRDGWLYTGDLAFYDADGYFRIVDRKKDLIITSGFNVYPSDVEHVLRQYPGLADVAVFGVPDDDRGELVKAAVVMKNGCQFNRRDFDQYARAHLAAHRRPRLVEVVTGDLPRNPLGKVLRRQLRVQHESGNGAAAYVEA